MTRNSANTAKQKRELLTKLLKEKKSKVVPASFAQNRLWLIDQLEPNASHYNLAPAVELHGELDVEALSDAFNQLVERHESLRTTFVIQHDEPAQVIHAPAKIKIVTTDLSAYNENEKEVETRQLMSEVSRLPFNLVSGPLFRINLVRLDTTVHLLLFTIHHIITDGWSNGILLRELGELYRAAVSGDDAMLPELEIQYSDFALWQKNRLSEGVLSTQLDYWVKKLTNIVPLDLPTDRLRPAVQTFNGALRHQSLSVEVTKKIRDFCQLQGVSVYMAMLACFYILLQRYTSQSDISVGSPIANRNRAELENLVGFFANTVVIRTDLSGDPDFLTLLNRVKENTLDAFEHQDLPFEKLVEELQPERNRAIPALFQVLFTMQNAPVKEFELTGLNFKVPHIEVQSVRFELEAYIWEETDILELGFVYNTDLFDEARIDRMMGHYRELLNAVILEPSRKVSRYNMLSMEERQQLVIDWPQTRTDYPREQTVPALFEQQVTVSPDAIALEYEGARLSYTELNERANQLAHYLQAKGVGPEVMVGISVERSLEMVIGLLGILKAGGAYLPLDADYPQSRLDFMLADAEVPVLLTQSSLQAQFESFAGATICLDSEWPTIAGESTDNPTSDTDANSLMYAIYTSGSTGQPKGTLIEHRSAVRLVKETNYVELGADEVFLQFAPISFDASTLELWGSLLNGARLVVFPAGRSSLEELGRVIEDKGVTTLWLTSALFSQMVDNHLQSLSGVRQLLAGGEALSLPHVRKMIEHLGENRLINGYGPTENTTFTCCHVMTRDSQLGQSVPIGRPISNTTVYILDRQMNPVPVGVAGELYIGGDGLARGYLHQPELTAQKFVADPFDDDPTARLYATGDLVRYRADGSIEFIGRIDHQVKVRGYRIELGEIETALTQQDSVSEAAALVRADEAGDKRLVAYVVPTSEWKAQHPRDENAELDPETGELLHHELIPELRQRLREQLPAYMVPSLFVVLGEFPLNSNGKLERSALPEPGEQAGAEIGYVAPRTELEVQLTQIWADVLKVAQVGIHDNFFDLGGHSLMATQVMSRIREQLKVEVPLAEMFDYPTVAELAPVVESILGASSGDAADNIIAIDRDADLPLSFAQERLWFLDRLQPGNPAYIIPLALRLKGDLHIDALLVSLNAIVDRHEALRTRFINNPSGPLQVIDAVGRFDLTQTDLSTLAAEAQEQEIRACQRAEKIRPFDLARDALMRGSLLRLADREHVLILTLHHIVSDGWSLGVLFRELGECYTAFNHNEQPQLAELPVQYADFAVWQRQWLSGAVLDKQVGYWSAQLRDLQVLDLPTDRPRPAIQTYDGAHELLSLDKELSEKLEQLSKDSGVTLFMTLLTVYMVMLHRYCGQDDIVIGSPIANRNRSELEGLIAIFVNMLVMRVDCSGNPDFNGLVRRVSEMALGAYEHQDIPFERLVDVLQVARDPSRNPLFQVLFALQNAPLEPLQLQGLTLEPVAAETKATRFDLECHVWAGVEGLQVGFTYNPNLFDASTITQMLRHYANLLSAVVSEPNKPIDLLPMLSQDETHLLLEQWNRTNQDYPREATIPLLVEAQVKRTPDSVAVEFADQSLSYRELDERAGALARQLQEKGVGPGQMVGVYMRRSLEMVISLYGIWKAGGAYVPLDPDYPQDRIAYMVEETGLAVLLTQPELQSGLPAVDTVILYVDYRQLEADSTRVDFAATGATADDLAYVIYTSGSTGQPKGVMNCHRGIVNRLLWGQQAYGLSPDDRVLQKTPFSFDVSIWEFFWPLITGARLVVAEPEGHKDPVYLSNLIREKAISTVHFVPSMLKVFLEHAEAADLRGVKRVYCSGEALPYELQQQFFVACDAELHNLYGPTEAAIEVSYWECRRDDQRRVVPMGKPTANTRLYILDPLMQPVPIGVAGELYIGGVQVALGYLGKPELTGEKFIADPFSDRPGARLYKTGDLVRYLPDGDIEYLGRTDNQVKLRGYRIELGEVETQLISHEMVQNAVVIVHQGESEDKRLVAYLVLVDKNEEIISDVREFLKTRLPEYMVPSVFMLVDKITLSPNGKVDYKNLPKPEMARHTLTRMVAPKGQLEKDVAEIWKQVLDLEEIGVEDNFFDLGGDSFLMIQLHTALEKHLYREIPITDLFRFTTIHSFAWHYSDEETVLFNKQMQLKTRVSKQRAAMARNRRVSRGVE